MRRRELLALPLAGLARGQDVWDVLLKNGHVLDLKNGRNGPMDVAVAGGKIARVAANLPATQAKSVVEASGYYVTPGLIDLHAHVDAQGAALNLNPDHNTLRYGVTTVVDAGSSGAKNFEAFQTRVIQRAATRVLAWLNIVGAGMYGSAVENDPREMDADAAARMMRKYRGRIVGIKTAHYQPADWIFLDRSLAAAEAGNAPVMVDFQNKPERGYRELLRRMRPGDLHTHVYGAGIPQLGAGGRIEPWVEEARQRGVLFDVGHGNGSFWFRIAAPALEQGFLPDTISTDLHKRSVMLPHATMTNVMSKLLNLGMTLEQVVERSTVRPAQAIRRTELGHLTEGAVADVAVLQLERGSFPFVDCGRTRLTGDRNLRCALTLRAGKVVWDADGLAAAEWTTVGPYTNFR